MMRFLGHVVRGLHNVIGITAPTPEQEPKLVLVWAGLMLLLCGFFALLVWVFFT